MYKENRKSLGFFLIAIILTLTTIATTNAPHAFAEPAPTLLIKPSSIINASLAPGTTLIINASVIDITDLTTWQVKIYFNASLLNCTNAWYPTDYVFAGKSTVPVIPVINNVLGYVSHGCTLMIGATGFTGSGTLCQIEFKVLSRGNCSLLFSRPYGGDTFLWDSNDVDIAVDIQDGYFDNREALPTYTLTITSAAGGTTNPSPSSYSYTQGTVATVTAIPDAGYILDYWELDGLNVGDVNPKAVTMDLDHTLNAVFTETLVEGTKLCVDPPKIVNASMGPSSTFSINITIDNVADLHICEFNLTYDTNILSWMSVEMFKVQDQTPSSKVICDDEAGYVWVKLTYPSSITTDLPLALVRIKFHVDAMGATLLDLNDTKLTDPVGQPIPHSAIGGFFATLIQDLVITNVVASHNWVYQGQLVNINVTVKNLGNQKESFDVKAYYDTGLIGTQHVTDMAPTMEATLTFTWNTSLVAPCHNYTITGEATILPYELNTADNTYIDGKVKVRFVGDLNGDNKVDMIDLRGIALAFASYPGHPRWNPDADIDQSGFVDMRDIRLAAKNFGKGCT